MPNEQATKVTARRGHKGFQVIRWLWLAAAGTVSAIVVAGFFLAATVILLVVGFFGAGCAFTERVVDRTILSSAEMRFDYLDPDRDITDITGTVVGGGGGGGGGC